MIAAKRRKERKKKRKLLIAENEFLDLKAVAAEIDQKTVLDTR